MYTFYALAPRQNASVCDDNESEMILGGNWDQRESLGVKSVHLGCSRYHRVPNRVIGC
jgi:hypothetical protein